MGAVVSRGKFCRSWVSFGAKRKAGYQRVAPLASRLVEALQCHGGKLASDDGSPPEAIRQAFGASKEAFEPALGSLYKARRIRFRATNPSWIERSRSIRHRFQGATRCLRILRCSGFAITQSLVGGGFSRPPSSVRKARMTFSSSLSNSGWSFSQPTKLAAKRLVISAFLPLW